MTLEVKPLIVTISDRAVSVIKSTVEGQPSQDLFLRVYVQGGCGGMSYGMALDNKNVDGDTEVMFEGVKVVVDKNSLPYVSGSSIDYDDSGEKAGFKIDNPNADELLVSGGGGCSSGSCGAGAGAGGCGAGSGGCC